MPIHDAGRKRRGFERVKGKQRHGKVKIDLSPNKNVEDWAAAEATDAETLGVEAAGGERLQDVLLRKLEDVAPLLWESDYAPLLAAETQELFELGVLQAAVDTKAAAPPSSYTQRGLVRQPRAHGFTR
jgi:hypothetical protein